MNFYVVPFKVLPLRYNTLVPAFFRILEALLICTFLYVSLSDSVFIFSIVAKRRLFMCLYNLGNRKKSQVVKSGEYGGWGMITVLFLAKKLQTRNDELAGQNSAILERTSLPHASDPKYPANRYAGILSNFSNSDSTILHNNFLHCFSVFIGCWRAGPSRSSVVIHLFSTFCEELVPFPFITQNLMHILWSIFFDSRKSPTHAKNF